MAGWPPSGGAHILAADNLRDDTNTLDVAAKRPPVVKPLPLGRMSAYAADKETDYFNNDLQPLSSRAHSVLGEPTGSQAGPPLSSRYYLDRGLSISTSMSGRGFDTRSSQNQLLGTRRPRPHKIWKKKFIKLLVVGDSGLGKTTLIKTLLSTPGERLQIHDGTSTPHEQFVRDPDSLCSTVTWKDEEDRLIWVYRVQDTPGYGDELNIMNTITMMLAFIEKQNLKWLDMETAKDRSQDLSEVEDPRVDVCLYCLPPHRLRPIDLRYMYELSKVVPVIPIITKADTMTIREATSYRGEVFNRLQNPQLHGLRGKIDVFQFQKETLERSGIAESAGSTPPFLVIASNDINDDMLHGDHPVFWPERRYNWGTAEAFNPDHSDLLHLRALLLKEGLEEIAKTKRQRYEGWRKQTLGGVRYGRHIRRFLMWTVIPIAVGLHVGRNGFDYVEFKSNVRKQFDKVNNVRRRVLNVPEPAFQEEEELYEEEEQQPEELPPPPPPQAERPKPRIWGF